nr:hypothetical protein [Tanacetum cinerariifolium]
MDSNPSEPLVSTPVNIRMHKEDQEATGGPTLLKVTSKERSNPQLSSGKGASSIARQVKEEESSRTIKLEDLQSCDKDEEDEVHTTINAKTKENLAPKSSSPGKRDMAYQRQVFTRKRVFTILNTAYPPSAIHRIHEDNNSEI